MPEGEAGGKILIVEDEESVRSAIEAGLELIGGFEVLSSADGEEGMRLLKAEGPDILLLDLVMPVIDGVEFLRILRAESHGPRPNRVILMTALENPVPESSFAELGIDMVLAKPFRLNEPARAVGAAPPF